MNKGDRLAGEAIHDEKAVWQLVLKYARATSLGKLSPHDLRRSCAKLCRKADGDLEQIQLLLGHASIQTTERYLRHIRTVPVPNWVKETLDAWLTAAGIESGPLFRCVFLAGKPAKRAREGIGSVQVRRRVMAEARTGPPKIMRRESWDVHARGSLLDNDRTLPWLQAAFESGFQ